MKLGKIENKIQNNTPNNTEKKISCVTSGTYRRKPNVSIPLVQLNGLCSKLEQKVILVVKKKTNNVHEH